MGVSSHGGASRGEPGVDHGREGSRKTVPRSSAVPDGKKDKALSNTHKQASAGASHVHLTVFLSPSDPRCHSPSSRSDRQAEWDGPSKEEGCLMSLTLNTPLFRSPPYSLSNNPLSKRILIGLFRPRWNLLMGRTTWHQHSEGMFRASHERF